MLVSILAIVNLVLILYMFLLSARIVLSWFSGTWLGRSWDLLCRVTDPWLGLFYRMRFLRRGIFDFTPVVAILVLVVLLELVNVLIRGGRLSVGFVLSAVLLAGWSGAGFLLLFFIAVGVLRTIPLVVRAMPGATLWKTLDLLVQPVVAAVSRLFRLRGPVSYAQRLLITLGLLIVAWLLGGFAVRSLAGLLQMLPF